MVSVNQEIYLWVISFVISDLITDRQIETAAANLGKLCSCIDGALARENSLESIRKARFDNVKSWKKTVYGRRPSWWQKNYQFGYKSSKGVSN
jgi:hypothetical protein